MSTSATPARDRILRCPNVERTEQPPKLPSHALMRGLRKIIIDHEGTEYTLRLTRQNKLLLTK